MDRTDIPRPDEPALAPSARLADTLQFDPQQAAVALAYNGGDAAPRVVAKGRGLLAQAIIERAHQHGVYVHESRELVALLIQLDLDQRIPPELYRAVAELLVWVYRLEQNGTTGAGEIQTAVTNALESQRQTKTMPS
jgi:flagellar biosynthesis protein